MKYKTTNADMKNHNSKKGILFVINTPAQAHAWIPVIKDLMGNGFEINILVREYGSAIDLLKSNGLTYSSFKPISQKYLRIFEIFIHIQKGCSLVRKFATSMIIGFGIDAALIAAVLRKVSVIFTDNEPTHIQNVLTSWFTSVIITPACFQRDIGKKQIRINGYKEFTYLHPNFFKPDITVFDELKIARNEKFIILRFNVFDAVHDIGKHGFSISDQFKLVQELKEHAHVFISPEGKLSKELESYRLPIPYNRIHHALYYAQLLVTDTQTMTTEAAILGTPVVRSNSWVGPHDMGNFIELEQNYDLIYSYQKSEQAIQKAIDLIKQPDLKKQWAKKREKLLNDKIDIRQFMVDFIENYPESLKKYKNKAINHENNLNHRDETSVY
jgi:uncharacterized protein